MLHYSPSLRDLFLTCFWMFVFVIFDILYMFVFVFVIFVIFAVRVCCWDNLLRGIDFSCHQAPHLTWCRKKCWQALAFDKHIIIQKTIKHTTNGHAPFPTHRTLRIYSQHSTHTHNTPHHHNKWLRAWSATQLLMTTHEHVICKAALPHSFVC